MGGFVLCSEGLFRREEMGEKMETIPGRSQCRVLFLLHSHGRGSGRGRKASIFFSALLLLGKSNMRASTALVQVLVMLAG